MAVPKPNCDYNHPSPNCGGYSAERKVEAWCIHITDGVNSLGWLTNPVSQASANWLVRRDGYIYELVRPDISPWTNGDVNRPDLGNPLIAAWVRAGVNCNTRTLTVELEGKSTYWQPGALTAAQEDALVALVAWGCDAYHLPADETHILRHSQINDVSRHNCPGFSPAEWTSYIARVGQVLGQPFGQPVAIPPEGQVAHWLTATGQLVVCVNFGGQAREILGVNYADLGGSVRNRAGEEYDRSIRAGVMGPWVKRAP